MVKASITKLLDRIHNLERKADLTHTDRLSAKRMQQWLNDMDGEFKTYHLSLVDLLDSVEDLETEQAVLNEHDDRLIALLDHLQRLATAAKKKRKAYTRFNAGSAKEARTLGREPPQS